MSEPATVFVADDNPAILMGIERALNNSGYQVRTARTGGEIVRLLHEAAQEPDLVLLDVMMPEMTGIEVLHAIRAEARWRDVPVVLITANNDGDLPVSALRDGAVDFLAKPFRLDELIARVASHVRRHQDLRRAREQARMRLDAIDLIRELNRVVTADEMFHLVTTRTAQILGVARCSVVVVDQVAGIARVAATSEGPLSDDTLDLDRYPEIRAAMESGARVEVPDVSTSALFEAQRQEWSAHGVEAPIASVVVVPFPISPGMTGFFVERSAPGEPRLGGEAADLGERVVEAIVQACGRVQVFQDLMEQRRRLHDMAHTDELTGVATRRSLFLYLEDALAVARQRGEPLSIVLLDMDHLKQINDSRGHLAGDAALRGLGEWLRSDGALRAHDRAGRYGGDEFVVVLPGTDAAGAMAFAERARARFSSAGFHTDDGRMDGSLSAGIACWPDVDVATGEELISCADAALYHAKAQGRDRVSLAPGAQKAAV
jgi:two-component system, cell cycle response regulator